MAEFEVLAAVVIRSINFRKLKPLTMNRRLRGTSPLQEIEAVDSEPTFEGNIAS
jgi:hypothetical protein